MASPFKRLAPLLLLSVAAIGQDLPKRGGISGAEPDPKLMLNDLPDLVPADLLLPKGGRWEVDSEKRLDVDVTKLAAEHLRAEKAAAQRERMFRAGIVSKVDAEQAALNVVRLANDLANARAAAGKFQVEELRRAVASGGVNA